MFESNPVSIEENAEGAFMRSLVCPVYRGARGARGDRETSVE